MLPHERSLVNELKNKPFAIVGVNSDPQDKLRTLINNKRVTWPCFFDGGDPQGPIASKWNVSSWPTIYLIDKKGIIRFKDHYLDEKLLRQLLEDGTASASRPAIDDGVIKSKGTQSGK
jgi:hypothetical protein